MITRRTLLLSAVSVAGLAAVVIPGSMYVRGRNAAHAPKVFEITKTDAEWRRQLTANQYAVLRQAGTERAGSSPLLQEKRAGIYHCAGCDLPAYSSEHKYDSGTGWPSFTQALENAVSTSPDVRALVTLTEVHCRRCGGHFGHIFNDGPEPLGKRHCINGLALAFKAAVA